METKMMDKKILEKVILLVSEHLGETGDAAAAVVGDLGADSLDVLEIVMMLEEEYDIEIPDEEIHSELTIGDLVVMVERLK